MVDNKTKTITVSAIEAKDGRYKITDQDNIKYSFFEQWQGEDTSAFASFKEMKISINSTCDIIYAEKPGEYQGKKITYRNIYEFKSPTQAKNVVPFGQTKQAKQNQDDYGRRLAIHGFVNALLSRGINPDEIKTDGLIKLIQLETRIENILNGNMPDTINVGDSDHNDIREIPTIQQDEPDDGYVPIENIPF